VGGRIRGTGRLARRQPSGRAAAGARCVRRKPGPRRPQRPARERRYTNAFGCAIKGNHSRYGDYIYHLPGQKYYDGTRPEALFCTES